jgi:hypothetical protein
MSNDDLGNLFGRGSIPVEPNADLRAGAKSMFELRQAWIDAGFSEAEAMRMLVAVIAKG